MRKKRLYLLISVLTVGVILFLFGTKINSNNNTQDENMFATLIQIVNYQSEWDASEDYRITSPLLKRKKYFTVNDTTLITQCSANNLFYVDTMIRRWQGPMSVAVFCEAVQVIPVLRLIIRLHYCNEYIATYVTFHLVTYRGSGTLKEPFDKKVDCGSAVDSVFSLAHNYDLSVAYPINVMRNVARRGLTTSYYFLIDVDMVPNPVLRTAFNSLMVKNSLDRQTVYIVPAFEMDTDIRIPETKDELKVLWDNGSIRQFYGEICPMCHNCVDYMSWFSIIMNTNVHVAYRVQWKDPCEPFYIASASAPLYDETFKQYGFNRVSQVCELYVAGYKFVVLNNAFLIHAGFKTQDKFHKDKEAEHETNRILFRAFKQKLKFQYPRSNRRCN